jgi:hypothetical protein
MKKRKKEKNKTTYLLPGGLEACHVGLLALSLALGRETGRSLLLLTLVTAWAGPEQRQPRLPSLLGR